jgi:hypothetical protein
MKDKLYLEDYYRELEALMLELALIYDQASD